MTDDSPKLLKMVRVCREFQKYTGNHKPIIYNIHSKYIPSFHIHPQLLSKDFFKRRKQFYQKLKKIVTTIETKEELLEYLEDEEVSFMLHHFGIQKIIQELKKYKKKQVEKKLNMDIDPKHELNESNSQQKFKMIKTFEDKLYENPVTHILWVYLCLCNMKKICMKSNDILSQICTKMILLGVIITIDGNYNRLLQILRQHSLSQLQKKLKTLRNMHRYYQFGRLNKINIIPLCHELKSWKKNGVKGIAKIADEYRLKGIELTAKHFFNYFDCKLCHYPHIHTKKNYRNLGAELLSSEWISYKVISNNHNIAKIIGMIKICISNDLISRVYELNVLSLGCTVCNEFFIAKRMVMSAYKLSIGYIECETFNKDYDKRIEALKYIWNNAKCNYCKIKRNKHKACTGCMKVVYCSRECQKMDWNTKHRVSCDGSWRSIYGAFKMTILDRI